MQDCILNAMDNQDKMEMKVTCDLCPEQAKTNCPKCDYINMCPRCCKKHNSNSRKSEHEVLGLCYQHGKPLTSYCRTCNQAVCSACEISEHNDEHHDVTSHREVLDETIAKTETSFTELHRAVLLVEKEVKRMLELCAYVEQKSGFAEGDATARTNRAIIGTRTKMKDIRNEIGELEKQIRKLVEQKDKLEQSFCGMKKDADMLEKEKTEIATDVRDKITTASTKTEQHLMMVKSHKLVMESKIEQRRAETSVKIILDDECVPRFSSISQDLMDFAKTSPEGDTNTVAEEVKRLVDELIPNIKLSKRTVGCINFPKERQCKYVCKVKNLPDGRLSILGRNREYDNPNTVYITDETSVTISGMIVDGIAPATDMTVNSTGELIVTRLEKPPIRIFKPDSGAYRDINIKHDGKVIDELWSVETDGDDNMFVTSIHDILVLNPTGNVTQGVTFSGPIRNMALSKVNRILYITTDDRLFRFNWSNNKLKEISSSPHGIKGFVCVDICIGSYGEVLIAGLMENTDVKVYQEDGRDGGEVCVWREIHFQDELERKSRFKPYLCSKDDQLWLGYDDKVEVFQMLFS